MITSLQSPATSSEGAGRQEEWDALDRALQDSFPASDALSATVTTRIGSPRPHDEERLLFRTTVRS